MQGRQNRPRLTPGKQRLGQLLTSIRQERELSKREVARRADVDSRTYANLEQGVDLPRPETLRGISRALGTPYVQLLAAAGYLTANDLIAASEVSTVKTAMARLYPAQLRNEHLARLIGADDFNT